MDSLDYLGSSPSLQLLKQLDTPLRIASIAQKTASQIDGILSSGAMVVAMTTAHQDWMKDLSSIATTWRSELQTRALQPTPFEKAIEALKTNLATEAASTAAWRETTRATLAFGNNPTQRIIEAMKKDWDPIAQSMNLAQKKWAMDSYNFTKIVESWRLDLARDSASLTTAWKSVHDACAFDASHIANALQPLNALDLQMTPAYAASISLEKIAPPSARFYSAPQIQQPNNILSRTPFSNYRMAESYDLLSEFERDLRHFIHQRMHEAFGPEWEKHRVPGEIYKGWREKQKKAVVAGEPQGLLIDYADFTDYVTIITQRNNWTDVFKAHFGRAEFVRESLYRLHPIRLCVMHSRPLPRNMWLVLQTETTLLSDRIWN